MCNNGRDGHAFYNNSWYSIAFSQTDRNGQQVNTLFQNAVNNGDEFWFKFESSPAIQVTSNINYVFTRYNCSFTFTDYAGILPNELGILRWYNTNPDL